MTTQVHPNGTTPAPTFTEAPASINVRVVSPAGFDYLLTMRAARVGDVLNQAQDLEKWLLSHHWTPAAPRPAAQAPHNGQASAPAEPAAICDRCGQPMVKKQRRDGNGTFWSCQTRYGQEWCKGKPRKDGQ